MLTLMPFSNKQVLYAYEQVWVRMCCCWVPRSDGGRVVSQFLAISHDRRMGEARVFDIAVRVNVDDSIHFW
jgi:hypothetical protein